MIFLLHNQSSRRGVIFFIIAVVGVVSAVAGLNAGYIFREILPVAHAQTSAILYVDQANPQCSNSGPGTEVTPFCTISAAAALTTAGTTVIVSSGNYPEQVTVSFSGTSASPVIFRTAEGANVIVGEGRTHGFYLSSKSWVTIRGFTVSSTTSYGIRVQSSSNITIADNHVTGAGEPKSGSTKSGIYFNNSSNSVISGNLTDFNSDGGIFLASGTNNVEVVGNISHHNARGYTRAAPGIDVRANNNVIRGNITYENEDTGIQLYQGASGNLIVNNLVYNNGDHGIDVSSSPNHTIVGNTVYNNVTAGINVEGPSGGSRLANNISMNNGINSPRTKGNIRVDNQSAPTTVIDYDLVYLSQPATMVVWNGKNYSSLAAFRAAVPTQEVHGIEAHPLFVNISADDFHLSSGSPAIDSADSGAPGASDIDLEGNFRFDDLGTPNTGAGPRAYDDRGAYELQSGFPDMTAPIVSITNPISGTIVSGSTVPVSAGASDNVGVAGVQFKLDGIDLGVEDVSAPFAITWDTTLIVDGAYMLTAVARDAAGNSATSTSINVTVDNTTPLPDAISPMVAITAPLGGAIVSGASIIISADASDNVGVSGVRFELDGINLDAEDTSAPYSIVWDTTMISDGIHIITAVARDAAGNSATGTPVAVTVNNNGGGAPITLAPIIPTDDTYIRSDSPDSATGGSSAILNADNTPMRDILLKFMVSGINGVVTNTTLRVHVDSDGSSEGGGSVYPMASNTWSEASATWNNAPAALTSNLLGSLGSVSANTWYEMNITSLVTGNGIYSIRVKTPFGNGFTYTSGEGTSGLAPQLIVTYQ